MRNEVARPVGSKHIGDKARVEERKDLVALDSSPGVTEGTDVSVGETSHSSGEMVNTPSSVVKTAGCSLAARILTYGSEPDGRIL